MIFLPTEVPYELSRDMFASSARSMRLYVKRVFINDKFEELVSDSDVFDTADCWEFADDTMDCSCECISSRAITA
jgi:hypothetical protein